MEKIYEVLRIKQVIQELEENEKLFIRSPQDAADIAAKFIGDEDREVFFVMCLTTKNQVIAIHRAHVGDISSSIASPRESFKSAILNNAASIIISHVHPSQNVSPSMPDYEVTERFVQAGKILGIEVLDHIIVNAKAQYFSFKEAGDL